MSGHPDLDEMARRVIDANLYMTLATIDPDGSPRLSPVYFTSARYRDFYWVSSPDAHHSHNVLARPAVEIVIYDSSVAVGQAEAVYISAHAEEIPEASLGAVIGEAFSGRGGARRFAPEELHGEGDLRLFVARATGYEVLVRAGHPEHGSGIDRREPADPTR